MGRELFSPSRRWTVSHRTRLILFRGGKETGHFGVSEGRGEETVRGRTCVNIRGTKGSTITKKKEVKAE